MPNLPDLKVTG